MVRQNWHIVTRFVQSISLKHIESKNIFTASRSMCNEHASTSESSGHLLVS